VTIDNLTPDLLRTLTVSNNLTGPDGTVVLVGYHLTARKSQHMDGHSGATGFVIYHQHVGVQPRVVAVAGGPAEAYSTPTAAVEITSPWGPTPWGKR
jgi:hypothetical protein